MDIRKSYLYCFEFFKIKWFLENRNILMIFGFVNIVFFLKIFLKFYNILIVYDLLYKLVFVLFLKKKVFILICYCMNL